MPSTSPSPPPHREHDGGTATGAPAAAPATAAAQTPSVHGAATAPTAIAAAPAAARRPPLVPGQQPPPPPPPTAPLTAELQLDEFERLAAANGVDMSRDASASSTATVPLPLPDDPVEEEDQVDEHENHHGGGGDLLDDDDFDAGGGPVLPDFILHDDMADLYAMEVADHILSSSNQADTGANVRELQEAINVSHPFGIKIWKPALYRKDRSINALSYSALHSRPLLSQGLSIFNLGNLLWLFLFGWWMCALYLFAAVLLLPFAAVGYGALLFLGSSEQGDEDADDEEQGLLSGSSRRRDRRAQSWPYILFSELARTFEYSKLLLNISGYIFWPFGKFIVRTNSFSSVFRHYPDAMMSRANHASNGGRGSPEALEDDAAAPGPSRQTTVHTEHSASAGPHIPLRTDSVFYDSDYSDDDEQPHAPNLGARRGVNADAAGATGQRLPQHSSSGSSSSLAATARGATVAPQGDEDWDGEPRRGEDAEPASLAARLRTRLSIAAGAFRRAGLAGTLHCVVVAAVLAPAHLFVIGACFFLIVSVPMAKLNYIILRHLFKYPLRISAHLPEDYDLIWDGDVTASAAANAPTTNAAAAVASDEAARLAAASPAHVPAPLLAAARPTSGAKLHPVFEVPQERHEASVEAIDLGGMPATPIMADLIRRRSERGLPVGSRPRSGTESHASGVPVAEPVVVSVTASKDLKVILCTHNAVGWKYYKYTFDGINIILINLNAAVVFALVDFYYLGPLLNHKGIGSHNVIFGMALLSVVPLAYLIGMAVSSITAQTGSLALGAVINATFGSIVEIILYCLALMEGKTRIVEGSVIGSFMAGLLALPGASMFSGGLRRKEQRFNAKAAGVTSTMLIMALIGAFGPTLFHEVYGTFELVCSECPLPVAGSDPIESGGTVARSCSSCRYHHLSPAADPVYVTYTRPLVYISSAALVLVYAVGLLFTLRTHAKRIYSDPVPQQVQQPPKTPSLAPLSTRLDPFISRGGPASAPALEHGLSALTLPPASALASPDQSAGLRLRPQARHPSHSRTFGGAANAGRPLSSILVASAASSQADLGGAPQAAAAARRPMTFYAATQPIAPAVGLGISAPPAPVSPRRHAAAGAAASTSPTRQRAAPAAAAADDSDSDNDVARGLPPVPVARPRPGRAVGSRLTSVPSAAMALGAGAQVPLRSASNLSASGGAGIVQAVGSAHAAAATGAAEDAHGGGHGGHDHPNWSTSKSAMVLLLATVMYSLIAEVLIDSVDHVIGSAPASSGASEGGAGAPLVDEKILGLTLFALVPTVTEFYNAIAFARQGNIVLSLEIGSAYTIQVALLQVPVLVAFSTYWRLYGAHSPPPSALVATGGSTATQKYPFSRIVAMLAPLARLAAASFASSSSSLSQSSSFNPTPLPQPLPQPPVHPAPAGGLDMFTLVFPRWDLVAVLFSVFTLAYLYIEGKSNYFKGAMLLLAYAVLMAAFFCAPAGPAYD